MRIIEGRTNAKVNKQLSQLKNRTKTGMRQGFYDVGVMAKREINTAVLARPRFGRQYKINGRRHIASRRGESFSNITGTARRTRGFDVQGFSRLEFGFKKNRATEYTKFLEESSGSRYRPTVKNASDKVAPRVQGIMLAKIKRSHDL